MNDSMDETSDSAPEVGAIHDFDGEEISDHNRVSTSSEDMSSDSEAGSNASDIEDEQDEGEDGDNHARREKIRQLLAQETKCVPLYLK